MNSIYTFFKNWRTKLKARRLYIELSDRLSQDSIREPRVIYRLEELKKLAEGSREESKEIFKQAHQLLKETKRTRFGIFKEVMSVLVLGFLILVVNRQVVFEHQQIPTGSMRPTFFEMDRLIISKTAFGINNPFGFAPLAQNKELFTRGQIVTFTSEGLALDNQDVHYFGLFFGKKRLVKRLMAKGSDTVYFYGGHIWIVDENNQLHVSSSFLEKPHDYIPFHLFFGHIENDAQGNLTSRHFQKTVFQLQKGGWNLWKSNQSEKSFQPWGIQNYGMTRLLTRSQAQSLIHAPHPLNGNEEYYLDIAHHATTTPTAISFRDATSPFYVHRSLLPLSKEHFKQLRSNLYTSRFRVKNQKAYRYDFEQPFPTTGLSLPGVPDGLYEFYHGIAYSVSENGQLKELEKSHELYKETLTPIFFNSGMDWTTYAQFKESISAIMPFRYIYYDQGHLKCLDALLMDKDDPALLQFMDEEKKAQSSTQGLYPSFVDEGTPTIDIIKEKGMQLGSEEVLLLGDNHAGSGDSRDFGLATYAHLQGSPLWRFWPLSSLEIGIDSPFRGVNRYDLVTWGFLGMLCFLFDRWRQWRFENAKKWIKKA